MTRSTFQEWEDTIDRLKHDAEQKEGGAAMARKMGDLKHAATMDQEAARMRQRCADLEINPPNPLQ